MEIVIKRIELKDATALSEISRKTFSDTFKDTCTPADMVFFLDENYNIAQVESELNNGEDLYYFAIADGQIAGYLRFMEDYTYFSLMKQWKALELKRLYILEEFQGRGVAQKLMDFFLAYATEYNFKAVWLGVWEDNFRAQKFYGKYGFADSGHTHDFPIGNTPQTDKWFWKFLD